MRKKIDIQKDLSKYNPTVDVLHYHVNAVGATEVTESDGRRYVIGKKDGVRRLIKNDCHAGLDPASITK